MRQLPIAIANYLNGNSGIKVRHLLWITARNRSTGDPESIGLWTGEDTQVFTIGGGPRTYYGCGQFISFGDITLEASLNVRRLSVALAPISPEVEQVFRGYDAKMAKVEAHLAFYNTETNNLVDLPYRFHKGWVDKFAVTTPAVGGEGEARMDMVSNSRILTEQLALKRSNDSQQRRLSTDAFFRDVNFSGQIQTPWGEKNTTGASGSGGWPGVARQMASRLRQGQ